MDKVNWYAIAVGIAGVIFAYITSLRSKNSKLLNENSILKGDKAIQKEEDNYEDAKKEANEAEGRYNDLRAKLGRKPNDNDS